MTSGEADSRQNHRARSVEQTTGTADQPPADAPRTNRRDALN
ncbi:hypothetical protein [Halorussus lipolyticus]|nr:hypothetical protein [Halorussus sp. DT80]